MLTRMLPTLVWVRNHIARQLFLTHNLQLPIESLSMTNQREEDKSFRYLLQLL
jgi:hypothetical protein